MTDADQRRFEASPDTAALMERILYEVKRVVVGQDRFLERVMVALLAGGHLLVEGVPGLAKTLTVKTLASVLQGQFRRIQFTPDLVPADLIGTRIYNQKTGEFGTSLDVHGIVDFADPFRQIPMRVVAHSSDQLAWLLWGPHLLVFPALYLLSAGGIAFAVAQFVLHPPGTDATRVRTPA